MGHLVESLDAETLQSVILAGNLDPNTLLASESSNRPGNWVEAQDRFLYAPGHHMLSHFDFVEWGTSLSAPYICAAIANLCSKPGVTPKMAVKALMDSADERPEKAIYGRGVIRADKALELLERGY
ncbi:MAG TPA: hypothetical protein VJL87_07710 [Bdellovibrionota bacterium]|nr:hypothetical protein [Bdellovibrionota bacterium]